MAIRLWHGTAAAALVLASCAGQAGAPADAESAPPPDALAADSAAADLEAADQAAPAADALPAGTCTKPADCPAPATACQAAACQAGKCATVAAVGPCEDGDPCTLGDNCAAGACSAGFNACGCRQDADCPMGDDLCAGTPYCKKDAFPWQCARIAGSAAVCDTKADTACSKHVCVPATGQCAAVARDQAYWACQGAACGWKWAPAGSQSEPVPCDDGNPCTAGDLCQGSACQPGATLCACAADSDCPDDGNLCNGKDYCDKSSLPWHCAPKPNSPLVCNAAADTACSKQVCAPSTGTCAAVPVENLLQSCGAQGCQWVLALPGTPTAVVACSDGLPCTTGDTCAAGKCQPGTDTCKCASDADCNSQEDGNLCNGTLYCHKPTGTCKINPATVVVCPAAGDTACAKNVCYPKTGTCQLAPVEFAESVCGAAGCTWQLQAAGAGGGGKIGCNDGNPCTSGEACSQGQCGGGTDTCACAADADCKKLDDGDLCNGTLYCDKAKQTCTLNPASVVNCPSVTDTQCSKNACNPLTGQCSPAPVGKVAPVCVELPGKATACVVEVKADAESGGIACNDGDPCTLGDVCAGGQCSGGANTCACKADADCKALDDGDLCNGTQYCNKQTGQCAFNPATPVNCPTVQDTPCQKNACHPKTGLCAPIAVEWTLQACDAASGCRTEVALFAQPTATCEDGEACTKGDVCGGGQCQGGVFVCECANAADCLKKDDGNLCNGVPYCDKTVAGNPKCTANPASAIVCAPATAFCTANACNPATGLCGLSPAKEGKACDDGTLCTSGDACQNGQCVGQAVDCNDGTLCTNDSCQPAKGCVHIAANCDDGNACSADLCDAKTGKCVWDSNQLQGKACSDADPCTVGDLCAAAACKPGQPAACPAPAKPCQVAQCVPQSAESYACAAVVAPDGSPCGDGQACTLDAKCQKGACTPGSADKLGLWMAEDPAWSNLRWTVATPTDDGGALVAGPQWSGSPNGTTASGERWFVAKVSADNKIVWQNKVVTLMGTVPEANRLALAESGGDTYLAGTESTPQVSGGGLPQKPFVASFGPDGKLGWKKFFGNPAQIEFCTAAALQPGGVSWLAGPAQASNGVWQVQIFQLAPTWEPVWSKSFDFGFNAQVAAVVPRDGGLLVAGHHDDDNAGVPYAAFVDAQGKLQWYRELPVPAGGTAKGRVVFGATLRQDGAILLAGDERTGSVRRPWAAGLKPNGELWWQDKLANEGRWIAVARGGGNPAVLAGAYMPTGATALRGWTQGTDLWGNGQWSAETAPVTQWFGAAALPQGKGWLTVGAWQPVGVASGWRPALQRSDAWGHATCASAGACATIAASACDDGDACTVDNCAAAKGCQSIGVALLRCMPNDGCSGLSQCTLGNCPQTAEGRVYAAQTAKAATHYAVAPLGDGSSVVAGTVAVAGAPLAWVGRAASNGELGWSTNFALQASGTLQYAYAHAAIATPDGGFLIAANGRENDQSYQGCTTCLKRYRRLRKYGAANNVEYEKWSFVANQSTQMQESDDLIDWQDGSYAWLWRDGDGCQLTRLNAAGSELYTKGIYTPPYDGTGISKLCFDQKGARASNGLLWAAGWRWTNNVRYLWLVKLDPNGAALVKNDNAVSKAGYWAHQPRALAALPNGGVAVLVQRNGASNDCALAGFDADAKLQWQIDLNDDATYDAWGLTAWPGGDLLLVGSATKTGYTAQYFDRRSPAGLRKWRALLALNGAAFAAAPAANGDVLVAGRDFAADGQWSTLLRATAWGQSGCAAAGGCAGKVPTACDDADPCTADFCDPQAGCQSSKIAGCLKN